MAREYTELDSRMQEDLVFVLMHYEPSLQPVYEWYVKAYVNEEALDYTRGFITADVKMEITVLLPKLFDKWGKYKSCNY